MFIEVDEDNAETSVLTYQNDRKNEDQMKRIIRKTVSRRRRIGALCALSALALIAAACGDSSSSGTSAPAGSVDVSTTDSVDVPATDSVASTEPVSAAGESDPPLTDDYSLQIARLKDVEVDTSEYATAEPFRVATIVQGPINGWGTIFDATMNQAMADSGKFDLDNSLYVPWDFDVANQANGIEDAIAQDVDAIMLTSLSRAGLAASVERATEAGIPVILCMAGAETDEFTAEVSAEMPRMGYESAVAVAESIGGEGKVMMMHGIAGVDAAEFWKLGAEIAFAEYPNIEIVAEQNGNWSTADALEVTRTILLQEPEIDAVWTGGFEMGIGIVDAFQEAGIDVPFIGGTGPTNGFLRIAIEDDLEFFAAQFPPGGSSECVKTMIDILEGNPVQKFTDVTVALADTESITLATAADNYQADLNDDFIGPMIYSVDVYTEAGF